MKAVILCAGLGSRLWPLTSNKPKCLITCAGKPILQYQIDAYRNAGIQDLIIVIGHEGGVVQEYCKHLKDVDITFVENADYESTNNMYSVFLAKEYLGDDGFYLSNGDVAISDDLIKLMQESLADRSGVAVQKNAYNDESMKISVSDDGFVSDISKQMPPSGSYGCSIDFYKFSPADARRFMREVEEIILGEENVKDWTEVCLQRLFKDGQLQFSPYDIGEKAWVEIDNYDDLAMADLLFSTAKNSIATKNLFLVDLDGTVYSGANGIEGADLAIKALRDAGKMVRFLSNNSSRAKNDYVDKLSRLGIDSTVDDFILSTDGLISFLKKEKVEKVAVLGTEALADSIRDAGIEISYEEPEYLVVGYDTELTYQKLADASLLLANHVDMLATHCDMVCPTEKGLIPDIGAQLALLEAATGKRPIRVFGKPEPDMLNHFVEENGFSQDDVVVIGDRLYTDIELASRISAYSVLVLSGETSREAVENSSQKPDLIIRNISEICNLL